MELLKDLAKRACVITVTAMMTLPGMAFGSALADDAPSTSKWFKICQKDDKAKKEVCNTAFELLTTDGQFLATFMVVEFTGEARRGARMILPVGLQLQPGLKVQVDENKAEDVKFAFCAPDGCIAEMLLTDATLADLKKGKQLTVGAEGQQGNPVSFNFPLDTFKAANEGKPLDEAEFRKRAESIQAEINSKRKSLEDELKDAQHKAQQSE